jgi:hypothetical protein
MERLVDAVYFDTSILRQQPFADLKRSLKPLLEDSRGNYPFEAWVPEVALSEWASHLAGILDNRVNALRTAARELRKHDPSFNLAYSPPWNGDSGGYARKLLEQQASDAGMSIAPTPTIDLPRLIEMSIAKAPPFDSTGRGFRDAIILETIAQHSRGKYASVVLLAADKDFADAALQAVSTESGVLIRRARDLQHAVQLVNEKFYERFKSLIRHAQEEALPLVRRYREQLLEQLRANLQPSEELLKGAKPDDGDFFWSMHRIDRILGYEFGDFVRGSDFPPLFGLAAIDEDRIAIELRVHVDFKLLVSFPTNVDQPRFVLPDAGDGARVPSDLAWVARETTVARDVPFVVSLTRDDEGNFQDLRLEQCDGRKVNPAG